MEETTNTSNKKVIAAFDFDGTITKYDSLLFFIWYSVNVFKLGFGTLKLLPTLVLYKLKIIQNYKAKEKLFGMFYQNLALTAFDDLGVRFVSQLDKMIKPEALKKLAWHRQMDHKIVIISASVENWIKPWAKANGINTVLATQIEVKNQKLTGKFLSKNCYGAEKVNRLLSQFPERDDYELYFYGDSNGDKELLAIADYPFYQKFE
ncbi:MAG: HAD family hydrolase [Janthinobacterium lividum]